jgi:hypothetical protein
MARKSLSVPVFPKKGGGVNNVLPSSTLRFGKGFQTPTFGKGGQATGGESTMFSTMMVVLVGLFAIIIWLISINMGLLTNRSNTTSSVSSWSLNPLGDAPMISSIPPVYMAAVATRNDPFNDPYAPPVKNDGVYMRSDSTDIRGLPMIPATCNSGMCGGGGAPINMRTRGYNQEYSQVGILTRERKDRTEDTSFRDNMILPLFGRRAVNGRDKYQYYSMSNTGSVNTKLPVKIRGKSCVGEYGCDELMNGDTAYVEGYNDSFHATVYENNTFSYIPSL